MHAIISIGIAAAFGAWLRWWFGIILNPIFPTIPLGTLAANIVGGFLIGVFIAVTRNHTYIPETTRLAITTGFLGGLTTFSTFSGETVTLLSHQEYFWAGVIIIAHVGGSILATLFGFFLIKVLVF